MCARNASRHSRTLWFGVAVCLLCGRTAGAEPGPVVSSASEFAIETWQTENGLPQNSVSAVFQGSEGYIWFGTYGGLVRFDGVRFVVSDSANSPNLRNNLITALFQDATGRIWIGHETSELSCLQQGAFSAVPLGTNWQEHSIIGIDTDRHGDVWALSEGGSVIRVRDHLVLRPLPGLSDSPAGVPSLVRDAGDKLWWLYRGVAAVVEADRLAPSRFDDSSGTTYLNKLAASRDGGLWVVALGRLRKWNQDRWAADLGACPWGDAFVMSMVESRSGRLFVGTLDKGLFVVQTNGASRQVTLADGLPHNWVRCLAEDREGGLWVGTGGGGLCLLRDREVVMVQAPDNFEGKTLLGVAAAKNGDLWVGTEGTGVYRYQSATGQWAHLGAANGLLNPFVWTVLADDQGSAWAGTWGEGVFRWDGTKFVRPDGLEQLRLPVTALLRGRGGALWLGTGSGPARYRDGRAELYSGQPGAPRRDVRALAQGRDGAIWFGMQGGGLGCWRTNTVRIFTRADGLPSDFLIALHADGDGALWIGTQGEGLCRLRDGKFRTITTRQGLPNDVIGYIGEDDRGNLWFSSQGGIFRAGKAQLNACVEGRSRNVPCLALGRREGLSTLACSGGFQPSAGRTPDGRFWFPTRKGLAVVDPAAVAINPLPPPVVIEEVLVEGRPAEFRRGAGGWGAGKGTPDLVVPPGKQRLEFRHTALSFRAPEHVRFQYRLRPLEEEWVEGGTGRSANYSYVPPGDYEFQVIACNNDGVWNREGARLMVRVQPQFWQAWWFRWLAVALGLGAVAGAVHLAYHRRATLKLEKIERERALERERTRIARDIHDDLGAGLTRITMLSETAAEELHSPEQVTQGLAQITDTARQLTRTMDEIVWAVNPRHDTFESLVNYLCRYAQSYLRVAGLRCRLDMPMQLPAWPVGSELRHNIFLAVKEALNNVVKHAHAHEVQLALRVLAAGFELTITDDGRGFDPGTPAAAGAAPERGEPGAGNGLPNMRQRLEQSGGRCAIDSRPGQGTQVSFHVKL